MFGNGRKTIGLFICQAVDYFQKSICEEVTIRAEELGYNVAVFSAFGDYFKNEKFGNGESVIANLPDYAKLDGVILVPDTFDISELSEKVISRIRQNCQCPVVSIREKLAPFHSFLIDQKSGIRVLCEHFIKEHGCRDICMMTGSAERADAIARRDAFIEVMKENHLPCGEEQIFYGDFWKNKGKFACEAFIDKRGHLPDAIICANDYMAISVCSELIERNISIPEQVRVGGYDGIWETEVFEPSITTVRVPFKKMGKDAVDLIHDINEEKKVEKDIIYNVDLIKAESCGCEMKNAQKILLNRKKLYQRSEQQDLSLSNSCQMSLQLENVEVMEGVFDVVSNFVWTYQNCKGFFICLNDKIEEHMKGNPFDRPFSDLMHLRISIQCDKELYECTDIPFERRELLPTVVTSDKPQVYYFFPFHYKESCFGYAALAIWEGGGYESAFMVWMANIANAVEDMYSRKRLANLAIQLEELSRQDMLTGLYNRNGFEWKAQEELEHAKEEGKYFFLLCADMNYLKKVNDELGHAAGDQALIAIGHALKDAAINGEDCFRIGGDEFCVVHCYEEKESALRYIERMDELLLKSEGAGYENTLDIARGYVIVKPGEETSFKQLYKESDRLMYEDKTKRKEVKNKFNK